MTTQKPAVIKGPAVLASPVVRPRNTKVNSNRTLTCANYPTAKWIISDPLEFTVPRASAVQMTAVYQCLDQINLLYASKWEFKAWFVVNDQLVVDELPLSPSGYSCAVYVDEYYMDHADFNFAFTRTVPVGSGNVRIVTGGYLAWTTEWYYEPPEIPSITWDIEHDWAIDLVTVATEGESSNAAFADVESGEAWLGPQNICAGMS